MTRAIRRRLERLARAAQARQDHAGEDVVGLEGWALLFAAMFAADEEPDAEAMAAGEAFAEAFVTHCRARGVRVSIGSFGRQFKDRLPGAWGEIMRLAAEADEKEGR